MKRSGIIRKIIFTAISLLLIAVVLLFTIDLGFLRNSIEEQVREATGRSFEIKGELSLRLGRELVVKAHDLELGNPAWAGEDSFIELGSLDAVIDTMSLWKGPVLIKRAELNELHVGLQQNEAGQANWQMNSAPASESTGEALPFLLESVLLTNADIELLTPRLDRPVRAVIDRLEERVEPDGLMHTDIQGTLTERPFTINGVAGPYSRLLSGDEFSFEGKGSFGNIMVSGSAEFDNIWSPLRPVFDLEITGPELSELTEMLGIEGLGTGDLSLSGTGSAENNTLTSRILGNLGELELDVTSVMPSLQETAGSSFHAKMNGPNFGRLARLAGFDGWPEDSFGLDTQIQLPGSGLQIDSLDLSIAGAEISLSGIIPEFPAPGGSELSLQMSGPDLSPFRVVTGMNSLPSGAFNLGAALTAMADGKTFVDMQFGTPIAKGTLTGILGAVSIDTDSDIDFSMSGDRLADFQSSAGDEITLPEHAFEINGHVKALPSSWELTEVSAVTGTTELLLNGQLGKDASLSGTRLTVAGKGTDFGKIFDVPGEVRFPDGPFTFSANIGVDEGRLKLGQTRILAGAFGLEVDTTLPWPIDLSLGEFRIETHGDNITRILPELAGLELDAEDFDVQANGNWRDGSISFGEANARIGDSSLSAKGTLDLPPNLSATDLLLEITSPDLSRLGTVNGERWGTVPFELSTSFKGTTDRFTMEQFQSRLGNSEIKGSFAVDFSSEIPQFDLRFSADTLNLKPFQTQSAEGENEEADKDARFIPQVNFPLEALSRVEGKFAFIADQVFLKRMTLHNNAMTGELRDGALSISEMGTDGYAGRLMAAASLKPDTQGSASLHLTARSDGLVINLSQQSEEDKQALPAFDIDMDLAGTGNSLRETMATLTGKIIVDSPGGRVKNKPAESVSGLFLAEVVAAISPSEARKDEINISCFAAVMDVNEGVITLDPGIAIQSDKLNVFATGNINLDNEKIDVNFRTETLSAAKLSASELISPYVKLSGTLGDPSVALDPKGTLLSGGAAYLSGGLSILAKKALGSLTTSKDPCAEHLAEAK